MSFQSSGFLILLGLTFLALSLTPSRVVRKLIILATSLYFYACFSYQFLATLLAESLYFYLCAKWLSAHPGLASRKLVRSLSIAPPIAALVFFKYSSPFLHQITSGLASLGIDIEASRVLAPIGISFFTFQGVSYLLDAALQRSKPMNSALDAAIYFTFFPHVLSGPIARMSDLGPQVQRGGNITKRRFREGVYLMLRGYTKKIVLADPIALHVVNPAFSFYQDTSGLNLLVALIGYTIQIYMDLSGYTDIARGSAKVLGFDLAHNFNRPYNALSVSQFWQRWHQSMSGFFRDYLFHAVGGSRYGNVYINLIITFVAIGCWHGMGWNFVLYGVLHGAIVGYERWRRGKLKARGAPEFPASEHFRFYAWFSTFAIVVFSRVLFRSQDASSAFDYLHSIAQNIQSSPSFNWVSLLVLVGLAASTMPARLERHAFIALTRAPTIRFGLVIFVSMMALLAFSSSEGGFIYFKF